jgi:hypothetical protein
VSQTVDQVPEVSDADEWWTAKRRAALVLSILKGETSASAAARNHGLTVAVVEGWKDRFLSGAENALRTRSTDREALASRLAGRLKFGVALLAVGLIWIGVRAAYWNGYYTEDSPGYVSDAIWMALGNYHARDYVNGLNIGTYLPVALPIALFGKSEIGLSLWPLCCSLLGVVSMGGLAGILFGRPFGLFAAFLYATYPGDVFFSTVVMPDSIQSGWLSISIFLIGLSYVGPTGQKRWRLAWGGVAIGICYLIRADGAILVPIGVGAAAILSRIWKREPLASTGRDCLAYLAGFTLVNALEGLAYLWAAHDFFLRFHVVNGHYGTLGSIRQWALNSDLHTIPFSIFAPVTWWIWGGWWQLNQDQAYHGLIFCWAIAALSVGLVALKSQKTEIPDRAVAGFSLAVLWLAWPLLYHQFGSQSLTHFIPIHRLSRHLVVYAPGAVFATVAGCFVIQQATRTWRPGNARTVLMVIACPILLGHLYLNWKGEQIAYGAYQRIKGTYLRIREHLPEGVQTIVGDPGDLCFFDFWLNPPAAESVKMMAFANYSGCDELNGLNGAVVLTQSNPGWEGMSAAVIQDTVKRLPCLLDPPGSWRLLYAGYPEKIYVIGERRQARR